ncbi:MAG: putative zinc-binding protein [Cyclobacteriaceae bacterium]
MDEKGKTLKPLVYSCSGCSSAAQMANYLAVKLDRHGDAEMSCIAGVGGNVKKLVRVAKSGRGIIAIDGCPLACVKACLQNHQVEPDLDFELTRFGVAKVQHQDFDPQHAQVILKQIEQAIREKYTVNDKTSVEYIFP